MPIATPLIAAGIGAAGSIGGSLIRGSGQRRGGAAAVDELTQGTERARGVLSPLTDIGKQSLSRLFDLTTPGGQGEQLERKAFERSLGANLRARGLTGSATEIAGLSDFQLGQSRNRQSILGLLSQLGSGGLQQAAGLETNLGTNLAQILSGQQINQSQNLAAGLTGVQNALQVGIQGTQQQRASDQDQAFQQDLLNRLLPQRTSGGTSTGGSTGGRFSLGDFRIPNFQ